MMTKLTKSKNSTKTSSPNYQLYAQLQYNLNKLCYYNVTIMLKLYYNVTKNYLIITQLMRNLVFSLTS